MIRLIGILVLSVAAAGCVAAQPYDDGSGYYAPRTGVGVSIGGGSFGGGGFGGGGVPRRRWFLGPRDGLANDTNRNARSRRVAVCVCTYSGGHEQAIVCGKDEFLASLARDLLSPLAPI